MGELPGKMNLSISSEGIITSSCPDALVKVRLCSSRTILGSGGSHAVPRAVLAGPAESYSDQPFIAAKKRSYSTGRREDGSGGACLLRSSPHVN